MQRTLLEGLFPSDGEFGVGGALSDGQSEIQSRVLRARKFKGLPEKPDDRILQDFVVLLNADTNTH